MLNNQTKDTNNKSEAAEKSSVAAPTISLPKGGGAIRGIGEKFAANPVTGTGSMTVPIATSPGRSGFGPQLALSYDSGAGNGPFGFGWSLSLPAITRKTDKGLPQYLDAEESDVFILSGAEDLVPELEKDQNGNWVLENGKNKVHDKPRTVNDVTYNVRRYRPRIEGLFARIERWTNQDDPEDSFWRSISKDNITTWYGKTDESRIYDPVDPTRIFSWLICESHDDKGNVIVYRYKAEDSTKVDLSHAHERNRTPKGRSANRYLKDIRYGNHKPYYPKLAPNQAWPAPPGASAADGSKDWFFEAVFDYGEHHAKTPTPGDTGQWDARQDPFSSYRAGFEVRTYRLCQRVLMFHHIPDLPTGEKGYDGLVRSTDFEYTHEKDKDNARNPIYTFLREVTQSGYKRDGNNYLKRSLPPVEFEYTLPDVQDVVEEVDPESLENLPIGLDGAAYQWTDLHGEGIPGILTEQAGAWFYKRNLSPINEQRNNGTTHVKAKFAPVELVAAKPNLALAGGAQFMDLAGDGLPDLVVLDDPMPGLYEHDDGEGWQTFRPFTSRHNRNTRDPNLKFVDLDGDGHADVLITEDDAFVWHPSLAEAGFGPARRVAQALDEEKGPHLVFADGTQSIYLADLSGDGLTDLVRLRNGEVCYWPNLGYGRFGAKVTMDHAPHFDHPDQFDHKRIRLADIDGTGTTDIIYLHRDGVRLYFNQSGNSWSEPHVLNVFPRVDDLAAITPVDLLGNGTACLVWSSPLPGDTRRPMRYLNLMGEHKPHLLVKTVNNLGSETHVQYAPSTKFYLKDRQAGKPWITRLPFPVHVVERVETYDRISRNRFVTRYEYHHGYFDGEEREFRGFGMVEQFDTEEFAALDVSGKLSQATNIDAASHVPPVHTKTWFHTGVYLDREHISRQFEDEYYREPELNDEDFQALLLPDTTLPGGLTLEEEREACRALKGMMLRQEVYADDAPPGSDAAIIERAQIPYTVVEQDFTIRALQPRAGNRHAVFFTHPREAITFHYERKLAPILNGQIVDEATAAADDDTKWQLDPRVQHALTLEVDDFGNVLKEAAIGYGRRFDTLEPEDREKQRLIHITCTENKFTKALVEDADVHRTPLPAETRTYELRQPEQEKSVNGVTELFQFDEMLGYVKQAGDGQHDVAYEDIEFSQAKQAAKNDADEGEKYFRHLIEHVRTLYRKDDLTALLPLGEIEPLALPGESYKLAFTPALLALVFQRNGQPLLPIPADVLGGQGADRGGYVPSQNLKAVGLFPNSDPNDHWCIPSGRVFLSEDKTHDAAQELANARQHFFLPRRYRDPFGQTTTVTHDDYDLLMVETRDPLGNRVTVGERDANHNLTAQANDYRVLQPRLITDPNRNRTKVVFDVLGMVVGTAVMGKPEETKGDLLDNTFVPDLDEATALAHLADPLNDPDSILQKATTRLVYDLFAYQRTKNSAQPQPAVVYTLARETYHFDLAPGQQTKVQHSFSYSDGFGREIQKKIQAEPEKINGVPGPPRWVGSSWTIFNNKGKPVRQYEPFFTGTHRFEFGVQVGVSPILFYDPVERVVATLHPNHTYEKVVFDPWRQTTYEVNDTVLNDPATDDDIKGFTAGYFASLPASPPAPAWETWYQARINGAKGAHEKKAAEKAAAHTDTPTTAYFDTLGRPFLTVAHNKVVCPNHELDGTDDKFHTRVELDIEGNQRAVRDAFTRAFDAQGKKIEDPLGRIVMRYDYDMLGNRIHQASMEAGERWMLNDVTGKPIRAWDSRGFLRRMTYDELRRPTGLYVTENGVERLAEHTIYGEGQGVAANHRTHVYQVFDGAGVVTNVAYDFKGNLRESRRELLPTYKQAVNWQQNPIANYGSFTTRTTYDALNRPLTVTTPDNSVHRPGYNEANLLEKVDVNLRGKTDANNQQVWTPFVTNIDYNAKGQRELIVYGNGAKTEYDYDPLTFRLTRLKTTRPAEQNGLSPLFVDPTVVQDLHYTYDPVGNITRIEDAALVTVNNGAPVAPVNNYVYDAIYRLIEAQGREHKGQMAFDFTPPDDNYRDYPFFGHRAHPNDLQGLRSYIERYEYDAVGNFDKMRHVANGGSWSRRYDYNEDSLIEGIKKKNNGLTRIEIGNGHNFIENYGYADAQGNDVHGCMTSINNLKMAWDFEDQLHVVERGTVKAYYVYDAAGQRVRKVVEKNNGALIEERIYLGGFEIFRQHDGPIGSSTVKLERETLHIMDDQKRIALVETLTVEGGQPASSNQRPATRFQLDNHLGSACLELDENGAVISYEEYHPYGTTSYQAGRNAAEVSLKRYRYTGKEWDEESGLNYHSARYYAVWLGRWVSADPKGLMDGPNLYPYARDNPVRYVDPKGTQTTKRSAEGIDPKKQALISVPEQEQQTGNSNSISDLLASVRGVAGSLQGLDIALRDLYKEVNAARTSAATQTIENLMPVAADASKAGTIARSVSDLRNLLRAATQEQLTPLGKVLSKILEKDRSWTQIVKKYGDPFDASLPAEQRIAIANKIAAGSAKSSSAMNALQAFGKGLMVLNVSLSAWQVGGGIDKMLQGQIGEGAVDVGEGGTNLSLTIGTYASVKSGVLIAETGTAAGVVTLGASVAAAGSVALAASTARAAVRGEETPLEVADEYYGTQFSDIYSWQKRSVVARIGFGILTMGVSEAWYNLNQAAEAGIFE